MIDRAPLPTSPPMSVHGGIILPWHRLVPVGAGWRRTGHLIMCVVAVLMRARMVLVVAVASCIVIGAVALFSPSGLARLERLRDEEQGLSADVDRRMRDNEHLADDIATLRGDTPASKNALEKRVREELGYVGAGEVVLTVALDHDAADMKHGATANGATSSRDAGAP